MKAFVQLIDKTSNTSKSYVIDNKNRDEMLYNILKDRKASTFKPKKGKGSYTRKPNKRIYDTI